MRVVRVQADQIRSLTGVTLEPGPGVTVIIGPNGAGKTNLIEAIYFGLTTRSFRTGDRRDLIPFSSSWARCRVLIESGEEGREVEHRFMAGVDRSEGTRFTLDGAAVDRIEAARFRPAVTIFSPDRLELVKGPPALRRSHLDSFAGTLWPRLAGLRRDYGRALAQRNALLSSLREGSGDRAQLPAWDAQVARTGAALTACREQAVEVLSEPWRRATTELGLTGETDLIYRPGGPTAEADLLAHLSDRLETDLRTGRTGAGPHHDEIRLEYEGRQLRRYGSQGQQRLGLLALLFAEREALLEAGWPAPLMLLDDVMSELDSERRERLVKRLLSGGQTVITAAEGELVPQNETVRRVKIRDLIDGSGDPAGSGQPDKPEASDA